MAAASYLFIPSLALPCSLRISTWLHGSARNGLVSRSTPKECVEYNCNCLLGFFQNDWTFSKNARPNAMCEEVKNEIKGKQTLSCDLPIYPCRFYNAQSDICTLRVSRKPRHWSNKSECSYLFSHPSLWSPQTVILGAYWRKWNMFAFALFQKRYRLAPSRGRALVHDSPNSKPLKRAKK